MKEFLRAVNLGQITSDSLCYCLCFSGEYITGASSITTRQILNHDFKVSMQDKDLFLGFHYATIIKSAYFQSVQVFANYQIVLLPPPKSLVPLKSPQMLCHSTPCHMLSLCFPAKLFVRP
jgi:hypothetical protein